MNQPTRGDSRKTPVPQSDTDPTTTPGGDAGFGGGNLVGSNVSGQEAAAAGTRGTTHQPASRDEADGEDGPIGSALADDHPPAGAGSDLSSGPGTLGANSGGERASAGRNDPDRSSRDGGNSRGI